MPTPPATPASAWCGLSRSASSTRFGVLVAWCETRRDFRHFRADRIVAAQATGQRYPKRRPALLKAWRESEGIPERP